MARYRDRFVMLLLIWASAATGVIRAEAFDSKTVPFTVSIDGETAAYREISTFLMPGATTTLGVVSGPAGKYVLTVTARLLLLASPIAGARQVFLPGIGVTF